jgi:hypothetical protein
MAIGELARRDQDVMLAPITAEYHALAQAIHHDQVAPLPGVVLGCLIPASTSLAHALGGLGHQTAEILRL